MLPRRHGRLELHPERAATGLSGDTSNTFALATGSATQLVFTTTPGTTSNGVAFTSQPVVKVEDSGGNVVASPSAQSPWARLGRGDPGRVHDQPIDHDIGCGHLRRV